MRRERSIKLLRSTRSPTPRRPLDELNALEHFSFSVLLKYLPADGDAATPLESYLILNFEVVLSLECFLYGVDVHSSFKWKYSNQNRVAKPFII